MAQVANGVEPEFLASPRTPRPATRVIFVAQWLLRKGIIELAEAFDILAARHPQVDLMCVGTMRPADTVRGQFSASTRNRVSVYPSVDRVEMLSLLARADIFVLPSSFEGFSSALLEGMAAGLAVVATPAGAASDLLADRSNALIVPFRDGRALASAVEELIGDDALRARLGAAARETASAYTWDRVNADYAAHLLGRGHAAGVPARVTTGPHAR